VSLTAAAFGLLARCFCVPILVLLIECIALGWLHSSLRRLLLRPSGSERTDLICFLAYGTGIFPLMIFLGSFGASYMVGRLVNLGLLGLTGIKLRLDTGSPPLNFVLYYFMFSFMDYWNHRFFHVDPFWYLHRIHHAAAAMNPLVEHRNHPAQHALEPLFLAWPMGLIAVSPEYLVWLSVLDQFYQLLVHADLPWDWGWFGRWVLISPAAHRIHHSAAPEHYGKNLSVLTLWDRLFGTWYDGSVPVSQLGVDHETYNQRGAFADIWRDYRVFFGHLRRSPDGLRRAASKLQLPS